MPFCHIRLINSEFQSCDEGREYPSLEAAVRASIVAASKVAQEMIEKGADKSAVEARLEQDGETVVRNVVSFGVDRLRLE